MKLAIGNAIGVPFRQSFISKYLVLSLPLVENLMTYYPITDLSKFNGETDYIDLPIIDLSGKDFSIEVKINGVGSTSGYGQGVFDLQSSSLRGIGFDKSSLNIVQFKMRSDNSSSSLASSTLENNTDYTITGTYDYSENLMKIYINGVYYNSSTGVDDVLIATNVRIGSNSVISGTGEKYKGDNFKTRIWTKTLSDTEVLQNITSVVEDSLVLDLDLTSPNNKLGVDGIPDLSGNGNHGTSYGKGEFTRTTNGTVIDHNGVIQTVGTDIARFKGSRFINDDKGFSTKVGENAISVNGTTEYVQVPKTTVMTNAFNNAFTVHIPVNPKSHNAVGGVLIGTGEELFYSSKFQPGWFIRQTQATPYLCLAVADGTSYYTGLTNTAFLSDYTLNTNYFISLVYTGTEWRLYNNGVLVNTYTGIVGGSFDGGSYPLKIGSEIDHLTRCIEATIDNVILLDIAQTSEQVMEQYLYKRKGSDYVVSSDNVILHLPLSDNSSTQTDISGNGNDGTFYSGGVEAVPTLVEGVYDSDVSIASDTLKGIMSYEGATNLFTYSEELSTNWSTSRVTTSVSTNDSPIKGVKYKQLLANNDDTQGTYGLDRTITGLSDSTYYSHSIYANYVDIQWLRLTIITKGNSPRSVWFDLLNGIVGTEDANITGKITNHGDLGYRCEVSTDIGTGATPPRFFYRLADTDNSDTFTGDGTQKINIIGAMLN